MAKQNPVPELSRFEDHDVLLATIKVTNAGDGLSNALSVEPQEFHLGDKVYVVLETVVKRVEHEPMKDAPNARQRVHVLKTESASIADGQSVAAMLDNTKRLLALRKEQQEEEKGQSKLPGTKISDEPNGKDPARSENFE